MNDLNQWLQEMENVGGSKAEQLPENRIELPEPMPSKLDLGQDKPEGLREVKYSPPGREPKLFEQMRKPENQQQNQAQQNKDDAKEALDKLQQRLDEMKKSEQQKPQQTPPMKDQQQQQQPAGKSPLELALAAAVAAAEQEADNRRKQQQQEQEQQQQQQQQDSQALSELVERVDNIDERLYHVEQNYVGEETFQNTVQALNEKVAKISKPTIIQIPGRPEVKFEKRVHCAFPEILELCHVFQQAYIVGPAGTGKTSCAEDVAKAMGLDFGFISCTAGMAEAHLLGRMVADGRYLPARFVDLFENGGLFLFDEVDAADANTLLVINSALANGILSVPNRSEKPQARRHPDFVCIVAANTLGTGSFEYHGRNYLDAAFLDRFALSRARVDYDLEMEREMIAGDAEMGRVLHKIRHNLEQSKTRRLVSTRAFIGATKMLLIGKTPQQVVDKITLGWTDEEKNRALKDVVVPKQSPLAQIGRKQQEAEKTRREQAAAAARKLVELAEANAKEAKVKKAEKVEKLEPVAA